MGLLKIFITYVRELRRIKENEAAIKDFVQTHGEVSKNSKGVIQAKSSLKKVAKKKDRISNLKTTADTYFPTIVMWLQRIFLGFQSVMYHKSVSLFHIAWVLASFIFS
jgi:hypothetical protein